jgi:hypothetical protein
MEFAESPIESAVNAGLVKRVGYLRRAEPFPTGDIDECVFERLCQLSQSPWQPCQTAGVHFCDLCRFTGNSVGTYTPGGTGSGYKVSAASSTVDLWIPGNGFLYTCPTSITHYIDAHGFRPPAPFCDAVLRCPPMRSVDYLKAVLANGGRSLGFGRFDKP